uniref:Transmembrane protein n=1 Tax=Amphora coffeiformis TaxID=265554 RepID=A0A7S3L200_9STRA
MSALVENVRYINITMVAPQQWPIWLGPAQQADNRNPCHPNPCSLCWPMTPRSACHTVPRQRMRNVTLQNVMIHNPVMSTGVLMGNAEYPIEHVLFDNVRVTKGLPPAITRRPLNETFPGTTRPVHDPFVPPAYANKLQRQLVGIYGWVVHAVRTVGQFVQGLIERIHVTVLLRLLQTQDGAQAWYFSYLAQALLDTVWIWIVCALGFSIAGVFSFRGWMRYRKSHVASNTDVVGEGAEEELLLRHPRVETRWPPLLCHLGFITLLCVCWGGALYTGTFPFLKPKWERTYRYFVCENVVNGTARGNTWPVPHCFKRERPPWWPSGDDDDENQDHRHHRRGHGSGHWSPRKVELKVELTVLAKTLAVVAAALLLWRRKRQEWRILRLDTTEEQAASVDTTSELASSAIPSFVTVQTNANGKENEEESRLLPLNDATTPLVAHRSGSVDFADPLEAPAFD